MPSDQRERRSRRRKVRLIEGTGPRKATNVPNWPADKPPGGKLPPTALQGGTKPEKP